MKENKLMATIIAAAILIAGSLVFLGLRMSGNTGSQKPFAEQLKEYQDSQKQAQLDEQAKQEKLAAEKAKNVAPINDTDHVYGKKDAQITIYEYSDFECPFCKRFYKTPAQLVKNNDGLVNTVFRHFPLGFHDPLATKQALASECVADLGGNDKFWQYHDKIYETTNSNGNGMKVSQLTTLATNLGISKSAFQTCLNSEKFMDKVKADIASGAASGVTGTPGNIIKNNKTGEVRFVPGAYPIESLQVSINELLGK